MEQSIKSKWQILYSDKIFGELCLWLMLFLIFSYPISASIPVFLNVPSTPINIGFRMVYLLMAVFLLIGLIVRPKQLNTSLGGWVLFILMILYSIRIFHDVYIDDIIYKSAFYLFSFVFGASIIPAIVILFCSKHIPLERFKIFIFRIVVVSNLVLLLLLFTSSSEVSIEMLMYRSSLETDESTNVINPITISSYGQILANFCLYYLFVSKKNDKFIYIIFLLVGLANLVLGGSRGPMLTFALITLFTLLFHFRLGKYNVTYFIKFLIVIISIVYVYINYILTFLAKNDVAAISRLISFLETGETTKGDERPLVFRTALNQFLDYPVFGDSYLCAIAGAYPHNIYVEVLMALGLLGGVLFLVVLVIVFYRIYHLFISFNEVHFFFALIMLKVLLSGMTSGNLFLDTGVWCWSAFFLTISKYKQNLAIT